MKNSNDNRGFQKPFRMIPETSMVFASARHESCFSWLCDGVAGRRPLSLLTGKPGTGKATLLRAVMRNVGPQTKVVFCFGSILDAEQLLAYLVACLVGEPNDAGKVRDVDEFIALAKSVCGPDAVLLIVIDEAQFLEVTGLELVFRLADRARDGEGGPVTVLAGDTELEGRLDRAAADHAAVRDAERMSLAYLSAEEVRTFVIEQLRQQGLSEQAISVAALQRVHALSRGAPRLVNALCSHALQRVHLHEGSAVTEAHVAEAAKDLGIEGPESGRAPWRTVRPLDALSETPGSTDKGAADPEGGAAAADIALADGLRTMTRMGTESFADGSASTRARERSNARNSTAAGVPPGDGETGNGGGSLRPFRIEADEVPGNLKGQLRGETRSGGGRAGWVSLVAGLALAIGAGITYEAYRTGKLENTLEDVRSLGASVRNATDDGQTSPQADAIDIEIAGLLAEAGRMRQEQDYAAALASIEKGLELDPDDAQLQQVRDLLRVEIEENLELTRIDTVVASLEQEARDQQAAGDHLAGLVTIAEALRYRPDDTHLIALRDQITAQQHEKAAAGLEAARRAAEVERLRGLAQKQSESGDHEGALASIDAALELVPGGSDLSAVRGKLVKAQAAAVEQRERVVEVARLVNEARAALDNEDYMTAQERAAAALEQQPDDAELVAFTEEIRTARVAVEERAKRAAEATALGSEARQALAADEFATALETADAALLLVPRDQTLIALRGDIENEQHLALEADRIGNEVARLGAAARALLAAGQIEEALDTVLAALELAPNDDALLALGHEIEVERQFEQQIARLGVEVRIALEDGDSDLAFKKVVAALTLARQDPDQATFQDDGPAQRVVASDKDTPAANFTRLVAQAQDQQRAGDFAAALESVDKARRLAADDPRLEAMRVQLLAQQRTTKLRVERSREVEQLKSTARSQLASGDFTAALSTVDSGLELEPGDQDLSAIRTEILAQQLTETETARIDEQIAALTQMAQRMRAQRDYDGALVALEEAISLSPYQEGISELYSHIHDERRLEVEQRRSRAALATLVDAAERHIQNAEYQVAERLLQDGMGEFPEHPQLMALLDRVVVMSTTTGVASTSSSAADLGALQTPANLPPHVAGLVESGNTQMRLRDIVAARLFFEAALEAGAPRVATLVGMTYDPVVLRQLGVVGVRADTEKALYWYQKGREAGDTEAVAHINALGDQR